MPRGQSPLDLAQISPFPTEHIKRFGEYSTHELGITPDDYDAHLDGDFRAPGDDGREAAARRTGRPSRTTAAPLATRPGAPTGTRHPSMRGSRRSPAVTFRTRVAGRVPETAQPLAAVGLAGVLSQVDAGGALHADTGSGASG